MYTQNEHDTAEQSALAIGQALKDAREQSGISLQDVADRTRISCAHLTALEAGDFERLPGVGYIPGFIRNYCQVVGIDAAPYVDSFKALSSAVTKIPEYSFPVQALVPRVAGSMIAMFAVLVGLSVYVGWTFFSYNDSDEPEIIASSISQIDQPDQLLENRPGTSEGQSGAGEDQLAAGPATDLAPAADPDRVAQTDSAPQVPAAVTPPQQDIVTPQAEQVDLAEAPSAPTDLADAPLTQTAAAPTLSVSDTDTNPDTLTDPVTGDNSVGAVAGVGAQARQRVPGEEVIIRATASSWVEVTRADGEVLVTKLMRSGDELVFSSDENLFLSTGNAGGLRLEMPNIAAFDAGQTGEILRDLRLSRDSIQNRQLLASY